MNELKSPKRVKRKVFCVFGNFDDKSDFVIEPAIHEYPCDCKDCKDSFWIEGDEQ